MRRLAVAVPFVLILMVASGCNTEVTYDIGDTGPAGGIIFYVDETDEFAWTYLEAAPDSTQGFDPWGKQGTSVAGTETAVGTGEANTATIIAAMNEAPADPDSAVWIADGFSLGGYDDWFLPSKDELVLLYDNLYTPGLSDFANGIYWSSSESDAVISWSLFFADSRTPEAIAKDNGAHVRAIRSF